MLKDFLHKTFTNPKSKEYLPTQIFLMLCAILAITGVIFEHIGTHFFGIVSIIDWFVLIVFTTEYLARIYASEHKISYILSIWGIVDLFSILPSFLGLGNFEVLKSLRIIEIIKSLKLLHAGKITEIMNRPQKT